MKKIALVGLMVILVTATVSQFFIRHINDFQTEGNLVMTGLSAPVQVLRDEYGIPYIFAENLPDLIRAQGFITAQHRLVQILPMRRLMDGRLSEIIGDAGLASDVTMRTLGIRRNAEHHLKSLSPESVQFIQYYVDGVNAYLTGFEDEFPMELGFMGITPELWEPIDVVTVMHFVSYAHSVNLQTELIAQSLVDTLGSAVAAELMPINISPDRVLQPRIDSKPGLTESILHKPEPIPLLIALNLPGLPQLGSNNWAAGKSKSASGEASLSNDPHVDPRSLSGTWHPQGLFAPEFSGVGVSIPGLPGLIIGRTGHIAFGVTNAYGDVQDLYIETIDPENPQHYLEGEDSVPFEVRHETIRIKDSASATGFREHPLTIRSTHRGPIITDAIGSVTSTHLLSLRWASAESTGSEIGIDKLLLATNVQQADEAVQAIDVMMFNWVFADTQGNIGRRASGQVPVRTNGDGTLPLKVIDGSDNWTGFIPKHEMPGMFNPQQDWVGTSNHDIRPDGYPYYYSSYFSPSYRYRRLHELMNADDSIDVDDHFSFMRDIKNLQVPALLPAIIDTLATRPEYARLHAILSSWDGSEDKYLPAPLIYHEIYRHLAFETFTDELGDETTRAMLGVWYFWQERFDLLLTSPDSHWFDDQRTAGQIETLPTMILRATDLTVTTLSNDFGEDPANWIWGATHTITYSSRLAQSGLIWQLLGGRSYSLSGSGETLNRAGYANDGGYEVTYGDSLRFVADMGDPDKVEAILPGGVVSRLFSPHFTDQLDIFHRGERIAWWLNPALVEAHAVSAIVLNPE